MALSRFSTHGDPAVGKKSHSPTTVSAPRARGHLRPNQQGNACGSIMQCMGCCLRVQHQLAVSLDVRQPLGQSCRRCYLGNNGTTALLTGADDYLLPVLLLLCQRAGDKRTSTRWLRMGTMEVTPSSVAFLMAHSKRSPLDTARARQVFSDDSVSAASMLSMSTEI